MADTIHQLVEARVLSVVPPSYEARKSHRQYCAELADALLASPELAAIIDLAAWFVDEGQPDWMPPEMSPEVRVMLADWLANRAEQKPEQ